VCVKADPRLDAIAADLHPDDQLRVALLHQQHAKRQQQQQFLLLPAPSVQSLMAAHQHHHHLLQHSRSQPYLSGGPEEDNNDTGKLSSSLSSVFGPLQARAARSFHEQVHERVPAYELGEDDAKVSFQVGKEALARKKSLPDQVSREFFILRFWA